MLISDSQLLPGLDLLLDLVFELGHVEHELVDLAGPHGELLRLKVVSEHLLVLGDSLLAPLVGDRSPLPEVPGKRVPVNGIPTIRGNSLLLLLPLVVGLPVAKEDTLLTEPPLKIEEPLDAAHVLILQLLQVEHLLFLLIDGLQKLINIILLFIAVDLVIVLVLLDVGLLHVFVLLEQVHLELLE